MLENELKYGFIESSDTLRGVYALCLDIFGENYAVIDIYSYDAWLARIPECSNFMAFAHICGAPIAAVLCRSESPNSLVMGAVCCRVEYRQRGITRRLVEIVEKNARTAGYKYITLGAESDAEPFYEKCGYRMTTKIHDQNIYQKLLI
jgi:GNAT superfamily N-acetyltransferase